ncbi:MAG: 2Fe-2S iron-sulfur cluster binding domain-containing protein [Eubacteriales bacterium]|jgi:Na+-transporting NADH:ubiquinone oxidoreductase subunit F|nr:2Fe-2S iron-sulfur cluster binding domain-containing protein [Eubacteriales bacterium]MDD4105328.1 2Fe-2S iron-sulfur cluster binding domain-containing protein [Eubacteriales bacterium]MDD4710641.1 2Fe-2S iron-sulfur cluster binding domain-containing protein [Eubacteriales bacterium]NLO14934.1 2Fe-2S iron-sulfur cluster binding domain-containing protein [Clostridiales bacterium]
MDLSVILRTVGSLALISGALSIIISLSEMVLNNYGTVELDINNGDRKLSVKGGSSLLSTLAGEKVFIPSACGGKATCGLCKVGILDGAGPIALTEEPYLTQEDRASNLRLSCQVKVKTNMRLLIPEDLFNIREYLCELEEIEDLTYDIKRLYLKLPQDQTINFKAGQFMQFYSRPYGKIKEEVFRAYSISSKSSQHDHVELLIRLVPNGIVTTYVHTALSVGDTVRLSGPYGDFYLRGDAEELIMIAGGSGLAPIRSLVYEVIEKGLPHKMRFFFGANKLRDLFYLEEFARIEQEHPNFKFIPCLAFPEPEDNWQGETGFVTVALEKHVDSGENREAYLCGSPGMLDACIKILKDKGFPDSKIFFDKF